MLVLRANFFDKMPRLPLSLDVLVSVKFPPRDLTFVISGVFQQGQLCITSCVLVSARWKFHFPRQKKQVRPLLFLSIVLISSINS